MQPAQAPPPPGRWVRIAEAAARVGMPAGMLKRCILSGNTGMRVQELGARGIWHVADTDLQQYAAQLQDVRAQR